MRMAIDAIAQAEGSHVAAPPIATTTRAPDSSPKHATPTPSVTTVLPRPSQQPAPPIPEPSVTPDGQKHIEHDGSSEHPAGAINRNTAKATAKLEKALQYLITLNDSSAKADKWVINPSILASLTGCYRPAITAFIEARKQKVNELNATHGLGPGHNRAKSRAQPNAIAELVTKFKEEVLGQPF